MKIPGTGKAQKRPRIKEAHEERSQSKKKIPYLVIVG